MRRPKPTKPIMPFMLGAIYRKTEAQDLLGIGRDQMRKLHRKGKVEIRSIGNKDYVKSDDIWNAMVKVPPPKYEEPAPPESKPDDQQRDDT